MLVTDSFVFLHIPKTAGSFIQTVLPDHLPVIKYSYRVWTHTSYEELPERWRHLPAFCVVRNPWDWYVSWFCYTMEGRSRRDARLRSPNADPRKRVVWEHVFRSGRADFKEAVTRACAGGFDHPLAPLMAGRSTARTSARSGSSASTSSWSGSSADTSRSLPR